MTDKIEVTQADRDAAADYIEWSLQVGNNKTEATAKTGAWPVRSGAGDESQIVQAFARHRIAAEQKAKAEAYTLAYDKVRGTNADMAKTPARAYQLCCGAANELRIGHNPAIRSLREHRNEGGSGAAGDVTCGSATLPLPALTNIRSLGEQE